MLSTKKLIGWSDGLFRIACLSSGNTFKRSYISLLMTSVSKFIDSFSLSGGRCSWFLTILASACSWPSTESNCRWWLFSVSGNPNLSASVFFRQSWYLVALSWQSWQSKTMSLEVCVLMACGKLNLYRCGTVWNLANSLVAPHVAQMLSLSCK